MASRTESDEFYVVDLCEAILQEKAVRQHRFEWLRGDYSAKRRSHSYLPVDAYWPDLGLVVEYAERQHTEVVAFFDRRDTVSGVTRGAQRKIYDQRRVDLVPANGLTLVLIPAAAFQLRHGKIQRDPQRDAAIVRELLAGFAPVL